MSRCEFFWFFRRQKYSVSIDIPQALHSEEVLVVSADLNKYSGLDNFIKNASSFPNYQFVIFVDNDDVSIGMPCNVHVVKVFWEGSLPRVAAKFFKLQPYKIFYNARQIVWIDANLVLHNGFSPSLLLKGNDIQFFEHNKRQHLLQEVAEVRRRGKDDSKILDELFLDDRHAKLALLQGRFINSKQSYSVCAFFNEWWQSVLNGSIRDQLSLPVVLSKSEEVRPLVLPSLDTAEVFSVSDHRLFDVSVGDMSFPSLVRANLSKYIYLTVKTLKFIKKK